MTRKQLPFLFNPALLSREELRDLFVARHAERDQVLAHLYAAGSSPQHSLLLGERGMGKTTLLLRLAHSIDEDPALRQNWLPVPFDEEQYNIGELADFWLNCFAKISEDTKDPALAQIGEQLAREHKGKALEEAALLRLREYSRQKGKSVLLLVDNFDLLLARIDRETQRLREVLQQETWLMLVGASAQPIVETFDYKSPFYEFFHVISLEPLDFEETLSFLGRLGHCFDREKEIQGVLAKRRDDLEILHVLVGGNLRTITILFSLLLEDSETEPIFLLSRLLDQYTTTFKDLVEDLPAQGQRVFDALARLWDPATAESVANELGVERGIASAQLHRLVDRGLAVKVPLPQRSIGFKVRDRFLNLWYLMRSGRGKRLQLNALLEFLSLFRRLSSPAEKPGADLVARLRQMELLDDATLQEAEEEARRLGQGILPVAANHAHLLALYLHGDTARLEEATSEILGYQPGDLFARVVRYHLLAQRRNTEAALEVLARDAEGGLPAALRFEQAQLLLELDRPDEAATLLIPLLNSKEIPAGEIGATAALIARKRDPKIGWLAQLLLQKAAERDPQSPMIPLLGSEVEMALEHPKQALEQFQKALSVAQHAGSAFSGEALLDLALRLAGDQPLELLAALKEVGLDQEWRPLSNALLYLGGESDRLDKLSPEMRTFTEKVLAAIRRAALPAPAVGH